MRRTENEKVLTQKRPAFFDEFSKVAAIVLIFVGVIASLSYPVSCMLKAPIDPAYSIAGLGELFGTFGLYGTKSYLQKKSLNDNKLKIDEAGDISPIPGAVG